MHCLRDKKYTVRDILFSFLMNNVVGYWCHMIGKRGRKKGLGGAFVFVVLFFCFFSIFSLNLKTDYGKYWITSQIYYWTLFNNTMFVLYIDLWQVRQLEISRSRMFTCINKSTAEMNYEPEGKRVGVMNILQAHCFNPQRTGGQSGETGSQSRSPLWEWPRRSVASYWEVGLICPVKELEVWI